MSKRSNRPGRPPRPTSQGTISARIGAMIRRRRQALRMTLADVEKTTNSNISGGLVAAYEKGVTPSMDKFLWLCFALRCHPMSLIPSDVREMFVAESFDDMVNATVVMGERSPLTITR